MDQKETTIANLQFIATHLAQQADGHFVQSRVFAARGFSKLAEKYAGHAAEERGWVGKCIDRILDLGGEVKLEAAPAGKVLADPVAWVKHDLQVSRDGLAWLADATEAARTDYATFDILRAYYLDEEEDLHWGEAQLELIDCIGVQNWLLRQL